MFRCVEAVRRIRGMYGMAVSLCCVCLVSVSLVPEPQIYTLFYVSQPLSLFHSHIPYQDNPIPLSTIPHLLVNPDPNFTTYNSQLLLITHNL